MSVRKGKVRGVIFKNLQSHRLTRLEIHPKITTITGENLTGKTACLRGMDAIVNFADMKIRSTAKRDKEEASARLIFSDSLVVTRRRTEGSDKKLIKQSLVVKDGEDRQTYRKLRRSLPATVVEQLNMGKVLVDKTPIDLNFAFQHDPAFLISSVFKGSLRLKMLGTVNEQVRFDQGLRILKAEEKDVKGRIRGFIEDIQRLEEELKEEQKKPDLSRYEAMVDAAIVKIEMQRTSIAERVRFYESFSTRVAELQDLRVALGNLPSQEELENVEARAGLLEERAFHLREKQTLCDRLMDTRRQAVSLEARVKIYTDIREAERSLLLVEAMEEQIKEKQDLLAKINRMVSLLDGEMKPKIAALDKTIESLRSELEEITKDGARCPFFAEADLQDPCRQLMRDESLEV